MWILTGCLRPSLFAVVVAFASYMLQPSWLESADVSTVPVTSTQVMLDGERFEVSIDSAIVFDGMPPVSITVDPKFGELPRGLYSIAVESGSEVVGHVPLQATAERAEGVIDITSIFDEHTSIRLSVSVTDAAGTTQLGALMMTQSDGKLQIFTISTTNYVAPGVRRIPVSPEIRASCQPNCGTTGSPRPQSGPHDDQNFRETVVMLTRDEEPEPNALYEALGNEHISSFAQEYDTRDRAIQEIEQKMQTYRTQENANLSVTSHHRQYKLHVMNRRRSELLLEKYELGRHLRAEDICRCSDGRWFKRDQSLCNDCQLPIVVDAVPSP